MRGAAFSGNVTSTVKLIGGFSSATNAQQIEAQSGSVRALGSSAAVDGGVGAEMDYTGGIARFFSYNRGTAAWNAVEIIGLTASMVAGSTPQVIADSNGAQLRAMSKAGDPTTTDIPSGMCRIVDNTSTNEVRLWFNDGGTMKKSAAMT